MANYSQDEKSTGLNVLNTLDASDLIIVGDVSDTGNAAAITKSDFVNDINPTVVADGITITGDGTAGNPLVATPQSIGTKEVIDTVENTITGTTSPTILFTESITAGLLGTNDGFQFVVMMQGTTTAGVVDIKYGGQSIGSFTITVSAEDFSFSGLIVADNAAGFQKAMTQFSGDPVPQYFATTVDSSIAQDLEIIVTPSNSADTITGQSITVIKIQGINSTPPPVHITPSVASYEWDTVTGGAATSFSVNKPSGLSVNDLLVAYLYQQTGSTGTITAPAGWTVLQQSQSSADTQVIAYKIADAGDTAGSNFTFNSNVPGSWIGAVTRFINPNVTTPVSVNSFASGSASTMTVGTVTPTTADSLICFFVANSRIPGTGGWKNYALAVSDPTWTEIYDNAITPSDEWRIALATGPRTAVTATGNGTVETELGTSGGAHFGSLLVLNPS